MDLCEWRSVGFDVAMLIERKHGGGCEPFAHVDSLVHLVLNLFGTEGFDHDEGANEVECGGVSPDWHDSRSHQVGEVASFDEIEIGGRVERREAPGGHPNSFSVVQSINDGLVQLPLVGIHSSVLLLYTAVQII